MRQIQSELLMQVAEVESSHACARRRLRGWAELLQLGAGVVKAVTTVQGTLEVADDGTMRNRYTGAVARWPTYEEVAQAVQEFNELSAKLEELNAEKGRRFGPS